MALKQMPMRPMTSSSHGNFQNRDRPKVAEFRPIRKYVLRSEFNSSAQHFTLESLGRVPQWTIHCRSARTSW
ncbi:MAG: hypothetical protein ACI9BW_002630 [Gammaproteobacteria bacterium]|jgi:hypothetical protein